MSNPQNGSKRPERDDYQQALQSMGTYMDISIDDLMTVAQRAQQIADVRATETISVDRVMTKPVRTVHPQTSLSEAAHIMVGERISGLPVVDEGGTLTGIITEADFLRALGVPSHQPHHTLWQTLENLFTHLAHHGDLEAPDDPIVDHMVHNVVTVTLEHNLHDVIEAMKHNNVKRVVVCDDTRQVLGMITRSDLVRVFFDRYTEARTGR